MLPLRETMQIVQESPRACEFIIISIKLPAKENSNALNVRGAW
jgi:hypothetical protein